MNPGWVMWAIARVGGIVSRIRSSLPLKRFLATFHQLNNTIHAPAALRPIIESIAAEGGYQNNVNGLMNHIQQRHDYLNQFIEPRLAPLP